VDKRHNQPYAAGELEVILSLAPTEQNIKWLSILLQRSTKAIEVIYKHAFEQGPFGRTGGIQQEKILEAKKKVGIVIGRKTAPKSKIK
jgi:hypothetical protein